MPCQHTTTWPPDERVLLEAYVFGEVLNGDDPLDHVKVALVLNLPSEDVPWESQPDGTGWLVDTLRLDKGGFAYWWRSRQDPVWNHYIREPVRFWSVDGPDEDVLRALAEAPVLRPAPVDGDGGRGAWPHRRRARRRLGPPA